MGRIIKRKLRPSRRPPPIYLMATPATFARIVQEATGCPAPASSVVRRQATVASEPNCLPPPPTASILSTLDTPAFLPDCTTPALVREPEDKTSSGGASLIMTATSSAREEEDSWLLQELEAMTGVPDFLFGDFPNLENWGII
jgi:hypothetical protein